MSNQDRSLPERFKDWAKRGDMQGSSQDADDINLVELAPWIEAGQMRIEVGNQKFFDLLEQHYPIGLNRIEWRGVQDHSEVSVLPIDLKEIGRASTFGNSQLTAKW